MQATETLCHLSVTDIKKRFYNISFFCKNEACVNCGKETATTLTWLLALSPQFIWDSKNKNKNPSLSLRAQSRQTTCKQTQILGCPFDLDMKTDKKLGSQTKLTKFCPFLTTYPPALTFSIVWMLTKIGHFWTTYLPRLVNVVCEQPLTLLGKNCVKAF